MELALLRQSSSHAKVMDAIRDLGCDLWSIHQTHPPYQTGVLASAGGAIYEGVTYSAISQLFNIFNIRCQWQDTEILIVCGKSVQ